MFFNLKFWPRKKKHLKFLFKFCHVYELEQIKDPFMTFLSMLEEEEKTRRGSPIGNSDATMPVHQINRFEIYHFRLL